MIYAQWEKVHCILIQRLTRINNKRGDDKAVDILMENRVEMSSGRIFLMEKRRIRAKA